MTFVVPTRNSGRTIAACLESISHQRNANVEIIVVDNHSSDTTVEIARRWADQVHTFGPERCTQRNYGASKATSEVVAFIDSDMVLEMGVAAQAHEAFEADATLSALVIPEQAFGSGPWIGARRLEKQAYLGDASVEAARIFGTDAFWAVGGYDETLIAAEDWDLADRVARTGHGVGRISAAAWHDEGRISLPDAFAKKRYYGRTCASYFARPPETRRSIGPQRLRPLVRHALRSPKNGGGLLVLKAVEAAGFAAGLRDSRRSVRA